MGKENRRKLDQRILVEEMAKPHLLLIGGSYPFSPPPLRGRVGVGGESIHCKYPLTKREVTRSIVHYNLPAILTSDIENDVNPKGETE